MIRFHNNEAFISVTLFGLVGVCWFKLSRQLYVSNRKSCKLVYGKTTEEWMKS